MKFRDHLTNSSEQELLEVMEGIRPYLKEAKVRAADDAQDADQDDFDEDDEDDEDEESDEDDLPVDQAKETDPSKD
jgi:hypothetical protein